MKICATGALYFERALMTQVKPASPLMLEGGGRPRFQRMEHGEDILGDLQGEDRESVLLRHTVIRADLVCL